MRYEGFRMALKRIINHATAIDAMASKGKHKTKHAEAKLNTLKKIIKDVEEYLKESPKDE